MPESKNVKGRQGKNRKVKSDITDSDPVKRTTRGNKQPASGSKQPDLEISDDCLQSDDQKVDLEKAPGTESLPIEVEADTYKPKQDTFEGQQSVEPNPEEDIILIDTEFSHKATSEAIAEGETISETDPTVRDRDNTVERSEIEPKVKSGEAVGLVAASSNAIGREQSNLPDTEKEACAISDKDNLAEISEKKPGEFEGSFEERVCFGEDISVEKIQQLQATLQQTFEAIPKIEKGIQELSPLAELIKDNYSPMMGTLQSILKIFTPQERYDQNADSTLSSANLPHHIRFDTDDEDEDMIQIKRPRYQGIRPIVSGQDNLQIKWKQAMQQYENERHEKEKVNRKFQFYQESSENEIRGLKRKLNDYSKEIGDLTSRLSREMGTKMASDESNLENVSIKNRPMNVADHYQMFCSNEWLDAKTVIDDTCQQSSDLEKIQMMSDILSVTKDEVFSAHKKILDNIHAPLKNLNNPMAFLESDYGYQSQFDSPGKAKQGRHGRHDIGHTRGKIGSSSAKELPMELQNIIADMLRKQSDEIDAQQLRQLVYNKLNMLANRRDRTNSLSQWNKVAQHSEIKEYISKACVIVWQMVIQRPQMEFRHPGIGEPWKGDKLQEVIWGSADPENKKNVVGCYAYPLLYHGDRLMAKGRVLIIKK